MSNLAQDLKKDIQINSKLLSEKLKVSNRIIILITVLLVPIAISYGKYCYVANWQLSQIEITKNFLPIIN